jgi:DnaK suppressor protein
MNTSQLEEFKTQLLALQDELLSLKDSAEDSTKPVELDQSSVGRISRMDAMQSQAMAQESLRRRDQQLVLIKGALRRIEAGDYGYCHICDEEIDPRRLAVNPTLTRCLACARKS